ncbi:MAG: anti-sigma regulatory factor [Candidatus Velamenicoccus archaeovorus]
MSRELRVPIRTDGDILAARQGGRTLGSELGLGDVDLTLLATAISEVARNILAYAGQGEILLGTVEHDGRRGIVVIARDQGPGIPDIALALQDGYSTSGSLGLGLPGARRLMDEFVIVSSACEGTTVRMTKWGR